jgi:hypothetical protein
MNAFRPLLRCNACVLCRTGAHHRSFHRTDDLASFEFEGQRQSIVGIQRTKVQYTVKSNTTTPLLDHLLSQLIQRGKDHTESRLPIPILILIPIFIFTPPSHLPRPPPALA